MDIDEASKDRDLECADIERLKLALQSGNNDFEEEFDSDEDEDGARNDPDWNDPFEGNFALFLRRTLYHASPLLSSVKYT